MSEYHDTEKRLAMENLDEKLRLRFSMIQNQIKFESETIETCAENFKKNHLSKDLVMLEDYNLLLKTTCGKMDELIREIKRVAGQEAPC